MKCVFTVICFTVSAHPVIMASCRVAACLDSFRLWGILLFELEVVHHEAQWPKVKEETSRRRVRSGQKD